MKQSLERQIVEKKNSERFPVLQKNESLAALKKKNKDKDPEQPKCLSLLLGQSCHSAILDGKKNKTEFHLL